MKILLQHPDPDKPGDQHFAGVKGIPAAGAMADTRQEAIKGAVRKALEHLAANIDSAEVTVWGDAVMVDWGDVRIQALFREMP